MVLKLQPICQHYMKTIQHHLLLLLFLLGIIIPVVASAQPSYLVKHYTRQDYQAGNQNWSVDTDSEGNIYIGNNDGLLKFNRTHWSIHRNPEQTIVRSVYVAPDRRIYTGSFEEFGYWEYNASEELHYHSLKPLLKGITFHNSEIWKIVEHNGKIYFQSFSSLFLYDGKTINPIPLPGPIIFLLKAKNKLFVQSVTGELYEISDERLKLVSGAEILKGTEVKTILPYPGENYLIGTTADGLFLYDGRSVTPWNCEVNDSLKVCQINNGIISDNRIILGTIVKGLFIMDMDGKLLNHMHDGNILQNNTVLSLCADEDGSIWVGLDRGIDNIIFNTILDIYQDRGEQLGAVYTAALYQNTLYVGTNRGIFTYSAHPEKGAYRYKGLLDNSQGQVWELTNIDNVLFCGHTKGTFTIDDQRLTRISNVSGGYRLCPIEKNGKDKLIQGTYSPLVIYQRDGTEWKYRNEVKGFLEPSRFLETDHLGNTWVGHAVNGLYKLQLSENLDSVISMVAYGKRDGFPSDFNLRVFKVRNRVVFTTGSSLYTWDDLKNKMILYTELNSQLQGFEASKQIINIEGNLYWFIKKNDIALFEITDKSIKMIFHMYLPVYGLNMVDNYENIVPIDKDRNLICLDNGFAIINLNMLKQGVPERAKIFIRDALSWNSDGIKKRHPLNGSAIMLSHAWNNISISYACVNSTHTAKLYQYKLQGIDKTWSEWTDKTQIEYTRLPKGEFTFMVRSLNDKGNLTEPVKLLIKVNAAWYASTFAYIVYTLLFMVVIFIGRHLIQQRVTRQHEKLRLEDEAAAQLEKERAEQEIIKLQNEKLQAEISHKNIQLADSTMAIIKKNELLIEINEELEKLKGRMGEEFPRRHFDHLNNLINKNISNDNDWKVFEELFDQAHENFFKRLKLSYPELTQSDLKLCAFLRLNLSSKEIAPLLNISFRGVETRRYRLRQRLSLDSDNNLVEFIMQF